MNVPSNARQQVGDQQTSFAGGYDSAGLRAVVPPDRFAAMFNMRALPTGDMAKRPGLKDAATSSATASSQCCVFGWHPAASVATDVVVTDSAGNVKHGTFTSGTLTLSSLAAASSAQHYSAVHFRDGSAECLYLACGTGKLSKWDNTTFTDRSIGLSLNLRKIWVYNQRLFGVTTVDQTLYWSALNNGDTIGDPATGGGFATIRTFGGQNVLGGFALGAANIILHEHAMSVFRGVTFDDINIAAGAQGLSGTVGAVTPDAYCVVGTTAYIVSHQGLAIINGNGLALYQNQGNRADPVREFVVGLQTQADQWSGSGPVSVVYNERANEVWCLLPNGTTGGDCFIYSVPLGVFSGHMQNATAGVGNLGGRVVNACAIDSTNTGPALLLAWQDQNAGTGAKVYATDWESSSTNSCKDGSSGTYLSSVQLRRFFTDRPDDGKSWLRLLVQMGAGGVTGTTVSTASTTRASVLATSADGVATNTSANTATSDPLSLISTQTTTVPLGGQGGFLDVVIQDDGVTTRSWSVLGAQVVAASQGPRGR